jgi:hypothetical protein
MLIVTIIAITSCEGDANLDEDTEAKNEKLGNAEEKIKVLSLRAGAYKNFLKQTDNKVGFHALKSTKDGEHSIVKSVFIDKKEPVITVEGKRMRLDANSNAKTVEDIYGKTLNIGFNDEKGLLDEKSNKKMYIPKKLNISKPVPSGENMFIYAFYKDFKLEWNADPQNEEGLMVSVMYDGRNVIPENNENRTVKNIDYIKEDNGKFILNNSIFDDIPNHALLDLMLLRGNVQIEEYDEETYKIFAESHQTISLVLIRDMNTVVTE